MRRDAFAPEVTIVASVGLEPNCELKRLWMESALKMVLGAGEARPDALLSDIPETTGSLEIDEAPRAGGIDAVLANLLRASADALETTATGYMAYIPGGGLFATAVADFIGDALNRYTGLAEAAPGLAALERTVLSWLATEFGYGPSACGLFTSGGSLATFTALTIARDQLVGETVDLREAVGYASNQAHASVSCAFRLAGVPIANLRAIECDEEFRLRPDELRRRIQQDRDSGLLPFIIIATAGSTNTGAIDPLPEMADIAAAEGLWLHVDGAYGGSFMLCPEVRSKLRGIERAQSITFDPHKGLFLPYGTGCLLLRDRRALSRPEDPDAPYIRDLRGQPMDATHYSPADFQLELSRPFRGLRLWLPLMLHGAGAFRQALAEKFALAQSLTQGLEQLVRAGRPIEIAAPCHLTVVTFRLTRLAEETLERWNDRNAVFLETLNRSRTIVLSSTHLPSPAGEVLTLRACVLSYRTHDSDIQFLLECIRSTLNDCETRDTLLR